MTLDEGMTAALRSLGLEASGAEAITALPWRDGSRTTLRVHLRNGGSVKARRNVRTHKLRRSADLVRALADPRLPRILAFDGQVCIEEWMEGTPLDRLPLTPERLVRAADLLGSLHARGSLGRSGGYRRAATGPVLAHARRHLGKIAAAGLLARPEAAALAALLEQRVPARAPVGVVHGDLCAENLVEDADARLFVVDNEGLQLGFLDLDLARTWYRWPMPALLRDTFVERYARWRGVPDAHSAVFWRIAATTKAAYLRLSRSGDRLEPPLRALRAILSEETRAGVRDAR